MSEFFLELFSEEIPSGLQKSLREKILDDFKNLFDKNLIKSKKSFSLSSPNRVVIVFEDLDKLISTKSEEIRGPKTEAPEQAIEGFVRSNKIERRNLYKKKTEKGEFYFYQTEANDLGKMEYVKGNEWIAGNISYHLPERPKWIYSSTEVQLCNKDMKCLTYK